MSRSYKSALFIALAGALLTGCGGGGGSSDSNPTSPPTINGQPQSRTAALGTSVTFNVTASGARSYQWFKGATAITGATNSSFTIASVTASDVGTYSVAVTNAIGTTRSQNATLSLPATGSPTITGQPTSVSVPSGSPASFSVTATGSGTLTYQWYKNDVAIVGATESTYNVAAVSSGNVGNYFVRVTNAEGSVDSNTVSLSIAAANAPRITTQPISKNVSLGANTTLTVVASGSAPLSYQWYKDGETIAGATGSTLTITSADAADAGDYYVIVTNSLGSATSNTATLAVITAPVITRQPESKTATFGTSVTFSVVATGSNLTYEWFKVGGGGGGTGPTLTLTASPATAGDYRVRVTNSAGSVTSDVATLTVITAPTITTQPASQKISQGASVTFTVVASSNNGTLTYQWLKNDVEIAGATGSTYTIPTVATTDAATYKVRVSNAAGSTTSNGAVLTVVALPVITTQPTATTVNAGATATFTVVATGSGPLTYQWYKNNVLIAGATNATYSIAAAAEGDEGSYKVVVTNDGVAVVTSNAVTLTVN